MNNAADRKSVRRAEKESKRQDEERKLLIVGLMSSGPGRSFVYEILERASIFATTFSTEPLAMAFNEGRRSEGLRLLVDVMSHAPDQYIEMMKEANARRTAAELTRSADSDRGDQAPGDDDGSDDETTDDI